MPQTGSTPDQRPSMQELLDMGAAAQAVCTPPSDEQPADEEPDTARTGVEHREAA